MDFWSRLIGGSGTSPTKPLKANTPAERLTAYKRTCNALQQLWRNSNSLDSDETALSYARNCIKRLNTILEDESRAPAPYPCLLYTATSQFYIIITKLALTAFDIELIDAAARFFNILVDGEAEGILDSRIFARALIDLVKRSTGGATITVGEYEEGNLIELLFAVSNKIRLDPNILPAWFYPERSQAERFADGSPKGGTIRKNDFPLFYLLVENVYHDGRIGDFARTGLLYLTETASKSRSLERWMIESDLATLMASGLGALYSRLSRRLPSVPQPDELPPVLVLSDFESSSTDFSADPSEFNVDMNAFIGYLMFWQDTLDHCASVEVTDTLLDHFQILFLEQLLYPSLLESSDVDGGSTASVITYLHRILEVVDHPDLAQRILRYLLGSEQQAASAKVTPQMSISRRKSLDLLTALSKAEENPSPDLFNLVDLVAMSIRSKRPQTVSATLKLVSVILKKHHIHSPTSLFRTNPMNENDHRNMSQLDGEMRELFSMTTAITDDGTIEAAYEQLTIDAADLLETHSCSLQLGMTGISKVLAIVPDDRLLQACSELLQDFFSNSVLVNLALTEVLAILASCPYLSLNGWFWASPNNSTLGSDTPTVMSILAELIGQVRMWQSEVSEWDTLVASAKVTLGEAEIKEPPPPPPIVTPAKTMTRSMTPGHSKKKSVDLSSQMLDAYAQSVTPRGRKPVTNSKSDSRSSPIGSVSPSPAPRFPAPQPRNQFSSPLREAIRPPSSTPSTQESSRAASLTPDLMRARIPLPIKDQSNALPAVDRLRLGSDISSEPVTPGTVTPSEQGQDEENHTVSLGHIITNAVILQEFILEMAAIAQTRASFFGEIRFD